MKSLAYYIDGLIRSVRDNPKTEKIPIGPNVDDPTYWRYFVIKRNRWLNIYLHNFGHDDAENLHDHRAANISFILEGSYYEERFLLKPMEGIPLPRLARKFRPQYSLTFRLPSTPHRVVLPRDAEGREIPCWSLFIKFPDVREWGFWEQDDQLRGTWVPYQERVTSSDPTGLGYGQNVHPDD